MPKKILLVDDDPDILSIGELSLNRIGKWDVVTAGSGQECIDLAASVNADAIVLDVMMPNMDGVQTFEKLRSIESTRETPIVMLTAKVQKGDKDRLLSLGIDGLLEKPFDPTRLPVELADILGW